MRIISILIFLYLSLTVSAKAQTIKISLYNSKEIKSVAVSVRNGRYLLKRGSETMGEYKKGSQFFISQFGNTLEVRDKRNFVGNFESVELICKSDEGVLSIKPVSPNIASQEFDDNLVIRVKNNKMQLINKLDMEKYIAAVIEAEGGNGADLEYYKAQAVLIRTFTIKTLFKHAEEGFDLCNEVHCQAYKHRSTQNPQILKATLSTAGKVLVDKNDVLIMSPFHSNCGGITSPSGMVWQRNLPYLQSIEDPFCTSRRNAEWSAEIPKDEWLQFLNRYTNKGIDYSRHDFSFKLPPRTKFISIHGIELNLRTVRETFALRSAYFAIQDKGDKLHIKGKGYGHGVGMCQEGAMEMAKVGYSWYDIIFLYFSDILIKDYREMELHRFQPQGL